MAGRTGRWRAALRTPLGAAAATGLILLALLAVFGPAVWGEAAGQRNVPLTNQPPSAVHLLGTDALGRDVLARVLTATQSSLGLALLATAIGVTVGMTLGTLPAVLGRRAGRLMVAGVNFMIAFPGLFLALFFAVVFGIGARGAVLAIGLAGAPGFARLVHTLAASVAGRDYVAAARILGVGRFRLVTRHLLPNIAEPLVVNATIGAGGALLAFAGLSFLGLGTQPPQYDWGRLLNEGLDRIYVNPAAALAPGVAVVLAGLAFALTGEACAAVLGLRSRSPAPGSRGLVEAGLPAGPPADDAVVEVADLTVTFPGGVRPVDGVSFTIAPGESVGLVAIPVT